MNEIVFTIQVMYLNNFESMVEFLGIIISITIANYSSRGSYHLPPTREDY